MIESWEKVLDHLQSLEKAKPNFKEWAGAYSQKGERLSQKKILIIREEFLMERR